MTTDWAFGDEGGGGACLASRSSIRSDKDGKTLSRPLSSHLGVMIECLFHPPWRSYLIGPPSLICQCRARSAMQTVMTNHVLFISVDPLRFVRDPRFAFLVSFFFGGGGGISSNVTTLSLEQILLHQCNDNFISFHDCSDGLVKKIEFHNNLAGYRNGRILYRKAIASFANFSRNNQLVRQRCSCECSRWRLSPVQFPRTVKLLLMSNR